MPGFTEISKKIAPFLIKYKFVAIIVLAGIILILLPDMGTAEKKKETKEIQAETDYSVSELENKLEDALSKSKGVGRVSVVLTLKSGTETIYAADVQSSARDSGNQGEVTKDKELQQKTVVISAGGGSQEALIIKKIYPEFKGAMIVCDGASSASVRLYVMEAVSALTGLSSEKITVIEMKD